MERNCFRSFSFPYVVVILSGLLFSILTSVTWAQENLLSNDKNWPTLSLSFSSHIKSHIYSKSESLNLNSAKGETQILKISLYNAAPEPLKVELEGPQGMKIPGISCQVFQLRPVPENLPEAFLTDGMVPLTPTPMLYGETPVNLVVKLKVGLKHRHGLYNYSLVFECGGVTVKQPITLRVWQFALPEDLPIPILTNCAFNYRWYERYGVDLTKQRTEIIPANLRFLREFKINGIGSFYPFPVDEVAKGAAVTDFTDYLDMLKYALDSLKFKLFRVPPLPNANEIGQEGNYFETYVLSYYRSWHDFLKSQGLLHKAQAKVWDEPRAIDFLRVIDAYELIKMVAPELRTESAGRAPVASFWPVIDVWVTYIAYYNEEEHLLANQHGQEIWLYANELHSIYHPPAHQRLIGWYLWRHAFKGYLIWSINYWSQDPWTYLPGPEDYFRRGTFFYPDPKSGLPWPTLRLEALRRGFEDYQYFVLMEQAYLEGRIAPDVYNQYKQNVDSLTRDMQALAPLATWQQLEEIRVFIGTAINNSIAYTADSYGNGEASQKPSRTFTTRTEAKVR